MVGPTPSISASSSSLAASIASMSSYAAASAAAAVGPTCRIDSATRPRDSCWVLACSRFAISFWAFADSAPALVVKKELVASASSVSANRSPSSAISSLLINASAALKPSTSMSNADRPARWNNRSRSCAGQDCELGQRMSMSPSFIGRSVVPQEGHSVGITHGYASSGRSSITGPRISGITSPALRSTTVSPG